MMNVLIYQPLLSILKRFRKTATGVLYFIFFLTSCDTNKTAVTSKTQPQLGFRSVEILKLGSLQFKDLNRSEERRVGKECW